MSLKGVLTPITNAEADVLGANGQVQKYPASQIAALPLGAQFRIVATAPAAGFFYVVALDLSDTGTAVLFPSAGTAPVRASAAQSLLAPSSGWLTMPAKGEVRVFVASRAVLAQEWDELNGGRDGDGNKQTGHEWTVGRPTQPTSPTAQPPAPPSQTQPQGQSKPNTPRTGN